MTTKDVCKIIALKSRITNPQDYALFKLVDGEGKCLTFQIKRYKRVISICTENVACPYYPLLLGKSRVGCLPCTPKIAGVELILARFS